MYSLNNVVEPKTPLNTYVIYFKGNWMIKKSVINMLIDKYDFIVSGTVFFFKDGIIVEFESTKKIDNNELAKIIEFIESL